MLYRIYMSRHDWMAGRPIATVNERDLQSLAKAKAAAITFGATHVERDDGQTFYRLPGSETWRKS